MISSFRPRQMMVPEVRKIVAHQNTASDSNTFSITFPDNMRTKFDMTLQHVAKFNTLKSGDELISLKETCGLREGKAEPHDYISV